MLLKFFSNRKNSAYLRSLASEFGESTNAIRVELNNLSDAGYLISEENGRTIEYQANTSHPLYPELKNVVHKYLGLDKIVGRVVKKLGDLQLAFLTGDYAKGRDSGIIDLVLIGKIDKEQLRDLCGKVEKLIKRKIRTLVLSIKEFEEYREKGSIDVDGALWLWGEETYLEKAAG